MELYPAIDIRSGRVVRLSQGEVTRQTVYGADPAAVAETFVAEGARWIAWALERRADLQAVRERRSAAEILRRAAEISLRPQLDVVFTPSYSGLVEGTGTGTFFSPSGPI